MTPYASVLTWNVVEQKSIIMRSLNSMKKSTTQRAKRIQSVLVGLYIFLGVWTSQVQLWAYQCLIWIWNVQQNLLWPNHTWYMARSWAGRPNQCQRSWNLQKPNITVPINELYQNSKLAHFVQFWCGWPHHKCTSVGRLTSHQY
jgi:hypothetical protein